MSASNPAYARVVGTPATTTELQQATKDIVVAQGEIVFTSNGEIVYV